MSRNKLIILIAVVALLLILIVLAAGSHKKTDNSQSIWSKPLPDASLPKDVMTVVEKFIAARDNSVGISQSSPTSWLTSVQSITTAEYFQELHPTQNSTGISSADYMTAHQSGFNVEVKLDNCIWDYKVAPPTGTKGAVLCDVTDTTVDQGGHEVSAQDLPFGWTEVGTKPAVLSMVKENGRWLVADDLSGGD